MNRIRSERGIALAVALFALMVVGGLVAAAFFVGVQEQRVGRNTMKLDQAFAAADGGAEQVISGWSPTTYNQMVVGDSIDAVSGTTVSGGALARATLANNAGWYRGSIKRINTELFIVRIEGFSPDASARQQVGVVVRLSPIQILVNSALKTRGSVRVGGSSIINGTDQPPTGWAGCPSSRPTLPAIRLTTTDSANIQSGGCGDYSCLTGTPKIQTDNTITSTSLTTFGDLTFDELRQFANKVLPPGTYTGIDPVCSVVGCITGSTCTYGASLNWGSPLAPTGPCGSYFPIIWIDGDASINGNTGQGILIVNGDLSVQGGFEFFGPVVVRQTLRTSGTGGHFNGGVIAANTDLGAITVLGDAVINYSSCALERSLNSSAAGAQMRERGWINMN
jgi:hypothetical protein